MNSFHHTFAHPMALWVLSFLPVLGILAYLAQRWRRRVTLQLSGVAGHSSIQKGNGRRRLRNLGVTAGLIALVLGIAGPQWGRDRDQFLAPGRDLVVIVDLSLSMLARDVPGAASDNRLGQALAGAKELANEAEKRGGHRLGLVVFASQAKTVCPLTQDYDHFRESLDQLDPFDPLLGIGPSGEAISGTRIGLAIGEAVRLLRESPAPGDQDIVLLSDGDDPAQDEEWRLGAELARKENTPIYTVGLGDPNQASPIPIPGRGKLNYHGVSVITRLEERPLQTIAERTKGTYTPARTKALPLAQLLYAGRELREDSVPVYQPRYVWFLGLALAFLAIPLALPDIGRNQTKKSEAIN